MQIVPPVLLPPLAQLAMMAMYQSLVFVQVSTVM